KDKKDKKKQNQSKPTRNRKDKAMSEDGKPNQSRISLIQQDKSEE
ncbi:hypothetical protein Tco_1224220, partial [Tanacetum coccineum]